MNRFNKVIKLIRFLDKLVDKVVLLFLLAVLLIAGLGLWDSLSVYQNADAAQFSRYKTKQKSTNFDGLLSVNSDVIAWLTITGTSIDYPIVQGNTNLEYINKSVDGEYSMSGSVFLDYRNQETFEDFYSLIYAHHMAGDVMFGPLPRFEQKAFFKKHRTAVIETKDRQKKKVSIFACVQTNAFDQLLFNPSGIHDSSQKQDILAHIKQKAIQYRSPKLTEQTKIIAFSTCEDTSTDGRIMVIGQID